jgi:oxygen-independent coproporphyrinogen-3 oxidase
VYIGMDHFALPDDELALARANGTLQRNFQGYSTHADCDLISLGVSSIGNVGDS